MAHELGGGGKTERSSLFFVSGAFLGLHHVRDGDDEVDCPKGDEEDLPAVANVYGEACNVDCEIWQALVVVIEHRGYRIPILFSLSVLKYGIGHKTGKSDYV